MANFKTHFSFGIILGIAAIVGATTYSIIIDNSILALVFLSILIGSFLPDLDSDGGTPFKFVINGFAFLVAVMAFLSVKQVYPEDIKILAGVPIGIFFFVYFVIGGILKKFTHHRGIFHSIPGGLIAAFGALLFFRNLEFSKTDCFFLATAVAIGYFGHLLLDELKSATGFNGITLRPEKSLGSALKFTSKSKAITMAVYIILGLLIYFNFSLISQYQQFLKTEMGQIGK